jgi:hypothetical protein
LNEVNVEGVEPMTSVVSVKMKTQRCRDRRQLSP